MSVTIFHVTHISYYVHIFFLRYFFGGVSFELKIVMCVVCVHVGCFIFYISITDSSLNSAKVSVSQSVQSLSHVQLVTLWTSACQVSLSITNSQSLLKLVSIKSVMPSNHLILCHPLLLPSSIFPSIMVFSSESVLCIR